MIIEDMGHKHLTTSCFTDENAVDAIDRRGHPSKLFDGEYSVVFYLIGCNDAACTIFSFLSSEAVRTLLYMRARCKMYTMILFLQVGKLPVTIRIRHELRCFSPSNFGCRQKVN